MTEDPDWIPFLEASLVSILETADEGLIVFDRDGRCRMIGRRAGELFGIEPASYVGKPRADVLKALAKSCEEPAQFLELVGGNDLLDPPRVSAEVDVRRPRPRKLLWSSIPILQDGTAWGRLGIVRDVTRERSAERMQKQLHARINELTPIDTLTGLLNLRRFREELEREHGRSTRAWDTYAVLRLDVDGMQSINDELGLPIGDEVLETVAERLKHCRREYDVVARYETDEFCVLLPGADVVAARTVAERMMRAVSAHDFQLADRRTITLSAGGGVWIPPSGEVAEDILRKAGVALERARRRGPAVAIIDPEALADRLPRG